MESLVRGILLIDKLAHDKYKQLLQSGKLIFIHRFFSWIGSLIPLISMLFIIIIIGYVNIGWKSALIVITAYIFAALLNLWIKSIYQRKRPSDNTFWSPIFVDQYSFPSGHAAGTMAVSFALGISCPKLFIYLFLWSIILGISRFFGNFHHLSDILVGYLIGAFSGGMLALILSLIL